MDFVTNALAFVSQKPGYCDASSPSACARFSCETKLRIRSALGGCSACIRDSFLEYSAMFGPMRSAATSARTCAI